jgi:4'-phosphopantetheinyl transferase
MEPNCVQSDCNFCEIQPLLAGDIAVVWLIPAQRPHLQALLAHLFATAPEALTIQPGAHGKLACNAGCFSVSHCQGALLVAASLDTEVGVDVEHQRELSQALQRRCFHASEMAQPSRLLQIWCVKEAVVKATGRGIAFGLQRLRIETHAEPTSSAVHGGIDPPWRLELDGVIAHEWQIDTAFRAPFTYALAYCGPVRRVLHYKLF